MIEIDVDDVEVTIETEGLTCESDGPGQIEIQEIDSAVAVSLREGHDNKSESRFIKNTALFEPNVAKTIATELKHRNFCIKGDSPVCDFWIDNGWWYHDATILHDDDGERMAYLEIGQVDGEGYVALDISGSDHEDNSGSIVTHAKISPKQQNELVAALSEVANECESQSNDEMEEHSDASEKTITEQIKRMLLYG